MGVAISNATHTAAPVLKQTHARDVACTQATVAITVQCTVVHVPRDKKRDVAPSLSLSVCRDTNRGWRTVPRLHCCVCPARKTGKRSRLVSYLSVATTSVSCSRVARCASCLRAVLLLLDLLPGATLATSPELFEIDGVEFTLPTSWWPHGLPHDIAMVIRGPIPCRQSDRAALLTEQPSSPALRGQRSSCWHVSLE